jgi:hypothetical protein
LQVVEGSISYRLGKASLLHWKREGIGVVEVLLFDGHGMKIFRLMHT